MKIESFFIRYAYPCAYIIMEKGEITSEELKQLENAAINKEQLPRELLEKIFYKAFIFIDKLAKIRNKQRWDPEIIKEYFYSYHNEVIDKGEGIYATAPSTIKELSRVDKAIITNITDDILTVRYKEKTRNVLNHFVPEAKINDKVTIHYGYAIEMVE